MTRVVLLVGTPKGAFFLESDADRRDWSVRGPLCEGWPIHDLIVEPSSGAIYAAGGSPWYGPAVWRSDDLGETWTHSSTGLTYGDGDGVESIKTVWSLAIAPDGAILAGVEPAGLFRSDDRGATWSHVAGLRDHETRPTWQPGAGGLILHTIVPHPDDPSRTWVGISAVGVFETTDGGATWEPRNKGVRADFHPDVNPVTGQCVHKFAAAAGEPETLYQQNHCGMYRSLDGGRSWTDLTPNGLPSQFGFPLVTHPRDPGTWWIIPLNGDDRGRYVPDGSPAVWRTHDRGDTWIRAADGLPEREAYLSVLREAMARDTLDPVGISFGTKTGQLWHSDDEGASWRLITANLPEIWGVEAVVID
ncbi:MAG: exo-alpha-sialidase [Chloroflexota bacterium]